MADSVMEWYDTLTYSWLYEYGVVFKGFELVYKNTGDKKYLDYIERSMNILVSEDGSVPMYKNENNIDDSNLGKALLLMCRENRGEKYTKAAGLLRNQLKTHPRTGEGGFWHKEIYPHQMWLDGLYMGAPFYAEYSKLFNEPENYPDVVKQFVIMEKQARDDKTGLLYHGWDESKEQRWADKRTGCSPSFWGRAVGWFAMALMDTLEILPSEYHDELRGILKRLVAAIIKIQDGLGLWWQVLDRPDAVGNYREASCSCMLAYALAKGVRLGFLDAEYSGMANRAWDGIIREFITENPDGTLDLLHTCQVAGLGANLYRDGTYEYYISEPQKINDLKGVGAFILAACEVEG